MRLVVCEEEVLVFLDFVLLEVEELNFDLECFDEFLLFLLV